MKEDFYEKLKEKLETQTEFPHVYMYKFIIPSDNEKLAMVQALFGDAAQVTTRQSSSNKFISVTANEMTISAEEIITVYKKAEKIEGIISL